MPETRLEVRRGPALYQQELGFDDSAPDAARLRRSFRRRLPSCPKCKDLGFDQQRTYRGQGTWACVRGHGLLES